MANITNEDELTAWLDGKDTDVAEAIAVRAALRAAPMTAEYVHADPPERSGAIVLPLFRAMHIAWFTGQWPNQAMAISAAVALSAAAVTLAAQYPALFGWLRHVERFLRNSFGG